LHCLAQMAITTLLIEGGSSVNASALSSGLVDKVFLYYAPKILAMTGAVPFATISKDSALQTISIKRVELRRFGQDIGIEGYLRDPYAD
jgi:diaminohydroxyphosphoribosylaminopyrimidine deaminase / 5-amino-6-(5-phosphoribosylamino)uracil reductase